jgi:hypothetical protein
MLITDATGFENAKIVRTAGDRHRRDRYRSQYKFLTTDIGGIEPKPFAVIDSGSEH